MRYFQALTLDADRGQRASAACTACSSPEITVLRGPFKAAIEIRFTQPGDRLADLLRTSQDRCHGPPGD